jgi:protease-4
MSRSHVRLLVLAAAFAASPLSAQTPVARPTPLPALGRSVVSTDDSTALVLNPANLAFLSGGEFRWSSLYANENAQVPYQGHAFGFAFPISFLNLSTGLRLDAVDPPSELAAWLPRFRADYQWLTWGLAFRTSTTSSLGLSYKHSYSDSGRVDGIGAWSLGASARPSDYLGLSVVANDIGSPKSDFGDELGASYDLGVAIRPLRSSALEVGLEGKYVAEDGGYWIPRSTLGVGIPGLGRLRGEFSVSDPTEETGERAWLASALMSFGFNGTTGGTELTAGTFFGDGLGSEASDKGYENLAIDVAFKGYREPAAAGPPVHALKIRIEDTPSTREHVAFLRRLWTIAEREPEIAAVAFELRASPAQSLARAQELRDAIHHLRNRGKQVLCHIEDGDGAALYMCSAAHKILVSPGGGLRFAGLRARYFYYRSLLEKLGVRADFVRIGPHKGAPESFTRDDSSDVTRADKIDLLQQYERLFTLGVSRGRKLDPAVVRKRIAQGPFLAQEAKDAGLVDQLVFDDELERVTSELVGGNVRLVEDRRAPLAPRYFGATPGVALIYVDGDIVDGRSQNIPFLGMKLVGSYTVAESLKQSRENPMVGAVVLRIESGGGSALAADVLWREVELTSRVKPVVVSMGSSAASAAYYLASPATRVFANPLTITGSIGVFVGKADVAELLRRIGVTVEAYKTTPRADAEAIYRPFTPEERQELERKVKKFYDQFLSRVVQGRARAGVKLTTAELDKVAQGRVWTGEQAHARRLVDEIGGLRQALDAARRLADLPEHAPVVELPVVETSLLGRMLGVEGLHAAQSPAALLPSELLDFARALAPFAIHPADKLLARIEIVSIGP